MEDREKRLLTNTQIRVLKCISQPGGMSSGSIGKNLHMYKNNVMRTVRSLREMGYQIQTSMVTEDGMYQANFELIDTGRGGS